MAFNLRIILISNLTLINIYYNANTNCLQTLVAITQNYGSNLYGSNLMDIISDNLKQIYQSFSERINPYEFFVGLADYVNYILETPTLKEIVNEVMKKKELEYEKLEQLERGSLQELRKAKEKLLKIIKDNNINPNSLQSRVSAFPWGSAGLLNELEQFENGVVSIGGFHSDNLEPYLFDIAIGISQQGRQDLVQEFIDPKRHLQNTHGNFVFSKTLNSRHEQTELIEQASRLELWGAFDHLIKFQKAYSEVCKNTHYEKVLEKYGNQSRNHLEGRYAVDITFATQDLSKIVDSRYSRVLDNDLHYLKMPNFNTYATRVETHLIKELSKIETEGILTSVATGDKKQKMAFNSQTGVVSFGDAIHKFHRGTRGDKERISLFKKLWDEKKYFKNGIEKTKGKTLTPEFLAVQLNITQNATTFSRNKTATDRFFGLIKGTNRILKDKGFPAKIERQGGIQLVIIEK